MPPSAAHTTSLGLLSCLPPWWVASGVIRPSGSVRDTWLEACSQASSRPCRSHVSPLDLLHGLRNVVTPSVADQRRRWSPGMSLQSRYCPVGCQSGPSVNRQPPAMRSNSTVGPTTSVKRGSRGVTVLLISYRGGAAPLLPQAPPPHSADA